MLRNDEASISRSKSKTTVTRRARVTVSGMLMITGLALLTGAAGLAGQATAAVPMPNVTNGGNRWLITGYFDNSPAHTQAATQGICFFPFSQVGTYIQGIWISDTFAGWSGRYGQEGDRVVMHGNFGSNPPFQGSDGMVIDLFAGTSPRDEGAGQWTEWRNLGSYGVTVAFGNARLRRVGTCQLPFSADASNISAEELERLGVEFMKSVRPRLLRDGRQAVFPVDPEQVPLAEEARYLPRD